jgi:peptidoglycan/LPS O-acetylase OafA/YrhL
VPAEIFAPLAAVCAAIVVFQYYRNRRLIGGIGWALVILSVGGFGSGLAESFSWSGFVFFFLGGMGVIAVLQDIAYRRHERRKRKPLNRANQDVNS